MSNSEEISTHIADWNALADKQEQLAAAGLVLPAIAAERAETYRRTAQALALEAETGRAHCTCCLKPMGEGIRL